MILVVAFAPFAQTQASWYALIPCVLLSLTVGGLVAWRTWRRINTAQQARLAFFRERQELLDRYGTVAAANQEQDNSAGNSTVE